MEESGFELSSYRMHYVSLFHFKDSQWRVLTVYLINFIINIESTRDIYIKFL